MSHTMLYKTPGPHAIHGGMFDYTVVADDAVEQALAEGWSLTTAEAKEAAEPLDPSEEIEAEKYDDEKLDDLIGTPSEVKAISFDFEIPALKGKKARV